MNPNLPKWRETLQGFLVRLGWQQADFADETERVALRTTGNPLCLSEDTVSLYLTKDTRVPRRRERHVELVDFFAIQEQLKNPNEANSWIGLVGHQLVQKEIRTIFGVSFTVIFKTPPSPEVMERFRKLLKTLEADIDKS